MMPVAQMMRMAKSGKRNRTANCEDNHEVDCDKWKIDERSQGR